jgi:uncharacterized protein (TIGR02217 family)
MSGIPGGKRGEMEFTESRFPTDIAYGASGGPEFSTEIVITEIGHENRTTNWEKCRSRYNVAPGLKTQAQLEALIAFFRARKGRAVGFRFKDWTDYQARDQLLGIGDGSRKVFRLAKHYPDCDEVREITKPVNGTVDIYVGGVKLTTGYKTDLETGEVILSQAPTEGVQVTADFEFDVPVRFDTDRISASLDGYGSHTWNDVPLIEIKTRAQSQASGADADRRFRERYKRDECDSMTEDQWGEWVDALPKDEFWAMMELGLNYNPTRDSST